MTLDNPFFHRGAIRRAEEFHGREVEIAQILGLCRNGQSVSIVGPRRIGKSSLLLQLCRPSVRAQYDMAPDEVIFALVDCQELGGSPPEEVYEIFQTSIVDAAQSIPLNLKFSERPGTYHSLDRILNNIHSSGISVAILLDEFELLAANQRLSPYFFARLRGLTTKYGLAYLTASQRPLFAITADEKILSSPFFNIFVTISLGLFNFPEAKSLLHRRLENTNLTFPNELMEHILWLAGYHPFFLHVAGYHAFEAYSQNPSIQPSNKFYDWLDKSVEMEADSHLSYLWQYLSPEERYNLAIVGGPVETMRQLEQQCLIQKDPSGYVHTSAILSQFIRRQHIDGLIQAGPFVIDKLRHQVYAAQQLLNLTNSQFDLLVRLGLGAGQVVPGEELEKAVWGDSLVDDPDRLKTLIKRLRRAIGPFSNWIVSERGIGYSLREPGE